MVPPNRGAQAPLAQMFHPMPSKAIAAYSRTPEVGCRLGLGMHAEFSRGNPYVLLVRLHAVLLVILICTAEAAYE